MKKIEIIKLASLSRSPMLIEGYLFEGSDPKAPTVAIVGALEGASIAPLYTSAKLVDFLNNKLDTSKLKGNILVIPSANHYALNINQRFWPLDKTDINMMFPGYDQGETTQRIAHQLFSVLQHYDYGVHLETRGDLSTCFPYVKLYKTGFEDLDSAKKLGLKLIHHRPPESIETVSLQYNWQLWESKACSIICPSEPMLDRSSADDIFDALLNYLSALDVIDYSTFKGYDSTVISQERIEVLKSPKSGIFTPLKKPGDMVAKNDVIGEVVHALEGHVVYQFLAPCDGLITCYFKNALIVENAVAYRIARVN